eukprot:Stramenopile-MAST_4_protein_6698
MSRATDTPCRCHFDIFNPASLDIHRCLDQFIVRGNETNLVVPLMAIQGNYSGNVQADPTLKGNVRAHGRYVVAPLRSAVPPLLTRAEWSQILADVLVDPCAAALTQPVSPGDQPGYCALVPEPMDLGTLLANLRAGAY